jgi:5S rRNA maturation endonuclease (ribonuclease M5)
VLSALEAQGCRPKKNGKGWSARCPAHDDKNPSLSVSAGNGRALVHCHAECPAEAVCGALGMSVGDLFDEAPEAKATEPEAVYSYVDEQGDPLFEVARYPGKRFRQRRPDGTWSIKGVRRVLFRLPEVLRQAKAGGHIVIVEGEKDVLSAQPLEADGNFVTTTWPGGAGAWRDDYANAFRGAKKVLIVPDADQAGRKAALAIAESLRKRGIQLAIKRALHGNDLTEHLAGGGTLADLVPATVHELTAETRSVASTASSTFGDPADLREWRKAEPVHWLIEGILQRGSLTLLSARGGTAKSLLALEASIRLSAGDIGPWLGVFEHAEEPLKGVYVDAECGRARIMRRIRELVMGDSFPPEVADLALPNLQVFSVETIAERGGVVHALPGLLEGRDVDYVVLDPLRSFMPANIEDENSNTCVGRLMDELVGIAKQHSVALLVIDHDSKSGTVARGASSKLDAAEMVLHLERPYEEEDPHYLELTTVKARDPGGAPKVAVQRVVGAPLNGLHPIRFEKTDLRKQAPVAEDDPQLSEVVAVVEDHYQREGTGCTTRQVAEALSISIGKVSALASQLVTHGRLYRPDDVPQRQRQLYPLAARPKAQEAGS